MKRISIIIILFSIYSFINAQIYVKALTGYSFSSNPQIEQSTEIINDLKNVYVTKFKNGEGINLGLAFGYNLNNYFSIELVSNTQIFTSQNISIPQPDYNNMTYNNFSFEGYRGNIKYTNTIFQFSPQFIYNIDYKKIKFYLKLGPNFMFVKNNSRFDYTSWKLDTFKWIPNHIVEELNTKGGLSIGVQSSFGGEYHLSENINLFVELLSVNANYTIKKSEIISYDIDGVNHLGDLDKQSQTISDAGKIDFSHIGFNIGIKYIFNKKSNKN
jgi:hypothetical protein